MRRDDDDIGSFRLIAWRPILTKPSPSLKSIEKTSFSIFTAALKRRSSLSCNNNNNNKN